MLNVPRRIITPLGAHHRRSDVAQDLGVSIPDAGLLIKGYALGVVFGGPILAIGTANVGRQKVLLGLSLILILGNIFCAIAPNYTTLMAARVITALCHGTFFGIASLVAAKLVHPDKRAQAIGLIFAGLTLANVLGVPLGTALGQYAGWRSTFWVVSIIGGISTIALWVWLPKNLAIEKTNLTRELRVLLNKKVLLALGMSVLASSSLFSVYTYIAPILQNVTGVSPSGITLILLLFGVGLTAGSVVGGRLADKHLLLSLLGMAVAVAITLSILTQTVHSVILATITVLFWGVFSFTLYPMLQLMVIDQSREAPNLSSTLTIVHSTSVMQVAPG